MRGCWVLRCLRPSSLPVFGGVVLGLHGICWYSGLILASNRLHSPPPLGGTYSQVSSLQRLRLLRPSKFLQSKELAVNSCNDWGYGTFQISKSESPGVGRGFS